MMEVKRTPTQQMQTHMPPGIPPKPKGPLIFRDYDQEELDVAYDQSLWAPNAVEVARRNAQKSAATLARLGLPRRLSYGPTDNEQLDLYTTQQPNAPVNIFIHGGGWRGSSAAAAAYMAEMFVDCGAHFVALDFATVTQTDGNLMILAEQVRRGVAWVYQHAAGFGGDPNRLHVTGTSSGGHLAAVVLTTDWGKEYGLPTDIVKGGLCCCGMYDLHPVSLSARSNYVRFTPEVIAALSPQRHLDKLAAPVIVGHGALETPEFQRQNREFAAAVSAAGKPVRLLVGDGCNHFEIQETIGNPYGLLGRAVLEQMCLAVPLSALRQCCKGEMPNARQSGHGNRGKYGNWQGDSAGVGPKGRHSGDRLPQQSARRGSAGTDQGDNGQ